MGTVPRPGAAHDGAPADASAAAGVEVRTLVRVRPEEAPDLLASLREVQQQRSSRRLPLVRISVNPPELF